MLSASLLAHEDRPLAPHDAWSAWNLDPVVLALLVAATAAVFRSWSRRRDRRSGAEAAFALLGISALAIGLVSPLDATGHALVSVHMVQHLLLILVAAPLLALSAPRRTFALGGPNPLARAWRRVRRLPVMRRGGRHLTRPVVVFLLYAVTLWLWHSAVLYDAAVRSRFVHALEHATFLASALLFWMVVLGGDRHTQRSGAGALLVFGTALHTVLLAALLTFARAPWYAAYQTTTKRWDVDPLGDQQLAGAIMWVPGGLIYTGVALILIGRWIHASDETGFGGSDRDARIATGGTAPR